MKAPRLAGAAVLGAAVCLLGGVPLAAQYAYYPGPAPALGGGFSYPQGITIDGSGNIYVADYENEALKEVPAGCTSATCTVQLGGRIYLPVSVALDGKGNVYVGYAFGIYEMPLGCGEASCMNSVGSYGQPRGLEFDNQGNMYITQGTTVDVGGTAQTTYYVYEVAANCITTTCLTQLGGVASSALGGLTVDGNGNVYVADNANNVVDKISPGCTDSSCVTVLGGGFSEPQFVAADEFGNVYLTAEGGVWELPVGCAPATCAVEAFSVGDDPTGIAMDGNGNVYVSALTDPAVAEWIRGSVDFGSVAVNATSPAAISVPFVITKDGTIKAPKVLTQGASGLDFTDVGSGTCTTNGTSYTYQVGDICTVDVIFKPRFAGTRYGAVILSNSSNVPIATAYVFGTGTGPQTVFSPSAQSTLAGKGTLKNPDGVAVDGRGNVYAADVSNNAVYEVPYGCASSACVKTIGGGFDAPVGVAIDGAGNIFVADAFNNAIKEMSPECGSSSCVTALGAGITNPADVAVDVNEIVYSATYADPGTVYEIPPGCQSSGCEIVLGGGFNYPDSLAVDVNGNVFVSDGQNNAVKMIPAGCASTPCVVTLGGGFSGPSGVAVDGSGNTVYVADEGNDLLKEMPVGCNAESCVSTLSGVFSAPSNIAVDGSGNLYVPDYNNGVVYEIGRATPPSLSFAETPFGQTSSDSPQTVTLENAGNAALTFSIPGTGNNPSIAANFALNSSGTTSCPLESAGSLTAGTLASGSSCTLPISFEPLAVGSLSGSLIVTDDNLNVVNATQTIRLSGTATQAPQTITFPTIPAKTYGVAPFGLSATASSGLAVSFASMTTAVCTVSDTTATIVAAGNCEIKASQAGDTDYKVATNVYQTFSVHGEPQTITFHAIANTPLVTGTVTLDATASSGLPVSFTSTTTTVCTVSASTVTLVAVGPCSIEAKQAGTTGWDPAPPVTQNFRVTASQTITFPTIPAMTYGDAPFSLSATASSGLAVSFASATKTVCTVSGTTATIVAAGNCTIWATQAGNTEYAEAPAVSQTFTVHGEPQTITFPAIANTPLVTGTITLDATASSGLAVSYTSTTISICTVSGNTVTLVAVGTCSIEAKQAGNTGWDPAPPVTQSFKVTAD